MATSVHASTFHWEMLFTWVAFRSRRTIKENEHLCLKIKSGSTYEKFPPISTLVSRVVNGRTRIHTHTHTLETRSNSLVCTHAECLSSTVVLWFSVLEWGGDVIVPLGFLGWGHSGATQPWSHRSFFALLPSPPRHTQGGDRRKSLKCYLSSPCIFFYTEVYPLSSHSHLDWIEKL